LNLPVLINLFDVWLMKKYLIIAACILTSASKTGATTIDSMYYGAFGKVTIYAPSKTPDAFVLFISGDGGWNQGVVDMAKYIVEQGAFVVGIDIRHYFKNIKSLKSKCYYPAGDFEELSLTIQKKYKFKQYYKPILIGYSSGATLVYGLLAQAPANTFKGAISLGFCPDIEIDRPLCDGSGLKSHVLKPGVSFYLESSPRLTAPFIVLEGMIDEVCSYEETKKYMENIADAEFISLPKVGHGFSVTRNWLPQYISAYTKILNEPGYVDKLSSQNELLQSQHLLPLDKDLPLILIPATDDEHMPMAFFISGDGGWTSFDNSICEKLAGKGVPVIGLDAQKYFWNEKKPEEASDDISMAIEHYMQQWNKNSFVLIGYSFGACVIPFIAGNFPDSLKNALKGVYCFSPSETGDFEIHVSDMLSLKTDDKYDVPDEVQKIKSLNPVCIFGDEEDNELREHFLEAGSKIEILPGSHHYSNDFNAMSAVILKNLSTD
jgi:type IV secretory pathway VirJ component